MEDAAEDEVVEKEETGVRTALSISPRSVCKVLTV